MESGGFAPAAVRGVKAPQVRRGEYLVLFPWYGVGRFWVEGLRTDSLYLFNWQLFGQPIRVSQALSVVMVLVSLFMLIWNLKVHPHKPEELYVNQVAARNRAEQNEKVQEE